jgi:predicted transcriptional regulator
MQQYHADSPIRDISYLARSEHRVPALVALTERPRSRAELCELTGVSSSTIRRTLDEFEDRIWIERDGSRYTATALGEVVATGIEALVERVETERELRAVWHHLPAAIATFSVDTWAALTVTLADPDAPYRPVKRFESLLADVDELRLIRPEIALMEPCFDVLGELLDDGADVVLVARPDSHAYFRSTYPDRSAAMMDRDCFTVLEHDDLPPYGTGLLDDHVTISCYVADSGMVRALVDTTDAPVREWAASVCEAYVADATPLDPASPPR